MRHQIITAAALCSLADVSAAASSYCSTANASSVIAEPMACSIKEGTAAESILIVSVLANVRIGSKLQLWNYLMTLRDSEKERVSDAATVLPGLIDVRPLRFFDNVVVLQVSAAAVNALGRGNLAVFLSAYEQALNKRLEQLLTAKPPRDREFRANRSKETTARLEVSQRLRFNAVEPDDPYLAEQWSLTSMGINAETAWRRVAMIPDADKKPVTVAVIDTDINPSNPDLAATVIEPGCDLTKLSQQSSVCPPVKGYSAAQNSFSHGTAVVGVIAASTNNSVGVASTTWHGAGSDNIASILPIQMSPDFNGEEVPENNDEPACTHNLLDALRYAVDPEMTTQNVTDLWDVTKDGPSSGHYSPDKGAKVINMSFDFNGCSEHLGKLMDKIAHHFPDVLLVNAVDNAGDDIDNDQMPVREFPASYPPPANPVFDNLLTVTNSDQHKIIQGNYGNTSVDIAAPGAYLPLLTAENGTQSGTSFAAPLVSSVAAVLKSLAPDWGYAKIREYIMKSRSTDLGANWGHTWSEGGILDMDAATKPPVIWNGSITTGTVWTVGGPKQKIDWVRTFDPKVDGNSLCGKLKLEAQYKDDMGNWPMDWKSLASGTVNTGTTVGSSKSKMVTVKAWGLKSNEMRSARVRLRCDGTQLFTVSETFTVKRN